MEILSPNALAEPVARKARPQQCHPAGVGQVARAAQRVVMIITARRVTLLAKQIPKRRRFERILRIRRR